MKLSPLFGLLFLPLAAFGKDTAYQALRTLGVERDQALLSRVIEVKGRNGAPQPDNWIIVIDDPKARGGVREIEVAGGHIVSERTPLKGYSGSSADAAMDFQKLNLDSQGAFSLVEEEARNARVNFDAVDYVLRRDDANGAPLWVIQLLDPSQRGVGSIRIAADTGTVLSRDFKEAANASRDEEPAKPRRARETRTVRRNGRERVRYEESDDDNPRKSIGYRIDRGLHRIGGSLQEFFTGRRTVDRHFQD